MKKSLVAAAWTAALLWVCALSHSGATIAAADDDPCFSLGWYTDLAVTELHEMSAYISEGNTEMLSADRDNFNHNLDVAASYVDKCQYEEPIARYDIERGVLLLDAAETGVYDDKVAAGEAYSLLSDAVCNDAAKYNADGLASLTSRVKMAWKRQHTAFVMPKGC